MMSATAVVTSIHIAPEKAAPTVEVPSVRAVPGKGLEGDRYYLRKGAFSRWDDPKRQVTLVEEEAVAAFNAESGQSLRPEQTRRNIVTRGIRLNDLVGKRFRIGGALLEGLQLCEPCGYLARMTCPEIKDGMAGRCGLRARVLEEGIIAVGDELTEI